MGEDAPLGLFEKIGRYLFGEPKPRDTYCERWGQHAYIPLTAGGDELFCYRCGKVLKVK